MVCAMFFVYRAHHTFQFPVISNEFNLVRQGMANQVVRKAAVTKSLRSGPIIAEGPNTVKEEQ